MLSWTGPPGRGTATGVAHVTKGLAAPDLVLALEAAADGQPTEHVARPEEVPAVVEATPVTVIGPRREKGLLTPREGDVTALIVAGHSNAEISGQLGISVNSVKTYVRTAYRKMGITRRSQAVMWGTVHGYGQKRSA